VFHNSSYSVGVGFFIAKKALNASVHAEIAGALWVVKPEFSFSDLEYLSQTNYIKSMNISELRLNKNLCRTTALTDYRLYVTKTFQKIRVDINLHLRAGVSANAFFSLQQGFAIQEIVLCSVKVL